MVGLIALDFHSFWWNSTLCFSIGVLCSTNKDNITTIYSKYRSVLMISSLVVFVIAFCLSYFVSYFEILKSISFALFAVMIIPFHKYDLGFLKLCSSESLNIYIYHVFLLQFFMIQNPIMYSCVVIFGTVVLLVVHKLIRKTIGRKKICKY